MTLKEAVLKTLGELDKPTIFNDLYKVIVAKNYYDFGSSKTPALSVSGVLTGFIQKGDTRVKRLKQENGTYAYYLTINQPKKNLTSFAIIIL